MTENPIFNPEVEDYYEILAPDYDEIRFGNSYGKYIDKQERAFLKKVFSKHPNQNLIVDLACGSGRFLEFADEGVDISNAMASIAQQKFTDKKIHVTTGNKLPYQDNSVDMIFSFHLLMHLKKQAVNSIFLEVNRTLRPGGIFLFDVPTTRRRNIFKRTTENWHASTSFGNQEEEYWKNSGWEIMKTGGVALFPVHRIPEFLRKYVVHLDILFCKTPLRNFASYKMYLLRKL
ncbi:MAG: methyltransferase domain-containing protein [Bacteroidetes bacterium]|nr:methyltransferase domain-containing protein [Bacteroidota bacterium]